MYELSKDNLLQRHDNALKGACLTHRMSLRRRGGQEAHLRADECCNVASKDSMPDAPHMPAAEGASNKRTYQLSEELVDNASRAVLSDALHMPAAQGLDSKC